MKTTAVLIATALAAGKFDPHAAGALYANDVVPYAKSATKGLKKASFYEPFMQRGGPVAVAATPLTPIVEHPRYPVGLRYGRAPANANYPIPHFHRGDWEIDHYWPGAAPIYGPYATYAYNGAYIDRAVGSPLTQHQLLGYEDGLEFEDFEQLGATGAAPTRQLTERDAKKTIKGYPGGYGYPQMPYGYGSLNNGWW